MSFNLNPKFFPRLMFIFASPPVGGEAAVRGDLHRPTLTLALSLQWRGNMLQAPKRIFGREIIFGSRLTRLNSAKRLSCSNP